MKTPQLAMKLQESVKRDCEGGCGLSAYFPVSVKKIGGKRSNNLIIEDAPKRWTCSACWKKIVDGRVK